MSWNHQLEILKYIICRKREFLLEDEYCFIFGVMTTAFEGYKNLAKYGKNKWQYNIQLEPPRDQSKIDWKNGTHSCW